MESADWKELSRRIEKNLPDQNTVHMKSWGKEIWIDNLPEYCGKILCFNTGGQTSMHYHLDKRETMHLRKGKMNIKLLDPDTADPYFVQLLPGDTIRIPRGKSHQLIALEESELLEFSTTHADQDSYRVHR